MMTLATTFLQLAAAAAGAWVAYLCIVAWMAMNGETKHCQRAVYGALGVCGAILFVLPMAGRYAWVRELVNPAMVAAMGVYMFLDRRGVGRQGSKRRGA